MRTLQNLDLNAVVGGVMAGDAPSGKTQQPARRLGESLEDYNKRLLQYWTDIGHA